MSSELSEEVCTKNLISGAECREIVKKAFGNVTLLDCDVVPAASDTIGYLGDYYKLNVIVTKDGIDMRKASFFIKSLPLRNDVHRAVITRLKFMDKEKTLYGLFLKMEKIAKCKWRPEVYLLRDDLLVLEDLNRSNYRHRSFNLDIPVSYVWPILKSMAAMHASSLVYEIKTGTLIGVEYRHLFTRTITKGNTWVNSGLKSIHTLAKIHPKFQTIEYQNFLENQLQSEIEKVHELGTISERYRNTLCHRDLWEKNVLFKKDANDIQSVLIDFQIARYIPPAIDVTLFLHMNANRDNRNANLNKYLDYYYDCLTQFCRENDVKVEDNIPRSEFDKSCEEFKLIPLVLTCVYGPIIFLPDFKILQNINKSDPVKFQQIMNDDRSEFSVEQINKYEDFGKRCMDCIEELIEYLYEQRSEH